MSLHVATLAQAEECPGLSDLQSLLKGCLDPVCAQQLNDHAAECPACKGRLSKLSAGVNDDDESTRTTSLIRKTPTRGDHARSAEPAPADGRPAPLATFGAYRLEEKIAEGACGALYRAVDERLGRTVAVKVLHGGYAESADACRRVEEEARAAAAINHESIVTVFDVSTAPGAPPYIVMEFLEGKTLRDHLVEQGAFPPRSAAFYVQQVAEALAAAHQRGLVHRDIKASNILLDEERQRAKLTDFGLARQVCDDMRLTKDNVIAGTPAYMSPEQIASPEQVGPLSDVYSLGVVLYELLTGELPFRGAVRMILTRVLHEPPRPPRELNSAVDDGLQAICLKAMAKDPQDRYDGAQPLADDLGRWLAGEPVLTAPQKPANALSGKRKKTIIALAATLLAIAGGFGVWATNREDADLSQASANGAVLADQESAVAEVRLQFDVHINAYVDARTAGDHAQAEMHAKRALETATDGIDLHGHPEMYGDALRALEELVELNIEQERLNQAKAYALAKLEMAQRFQQAHRRHALCGVKLRRAMAELGEVALLKDDLAEAEGHFSAALESYQPSPDSSPDEMQTHVETSLGMAKVYRNRRQDDLAARWASEALGTLNQLQNSRRLASQKDFRQWAAQQQKLIDLLSPTAPRR